jgi:DNA-binding response OmpR family regulator
MALNRYDNLRLVLGESNPDLSSSIKAALSSRGMRNVTSCRDTDKLVSALEQEMADLLIYDYDLPGDDFVEVTQCVRKKQKGRNPFVLVVATVKESQTETVKRLIAAGIDDLVRKPISFDRLFDRITGFSRGRKPFVVTYSYVGPTRRTRARPDDNPSQLIQVPNPVRAKVVEGASDEDLMRMINASVATLDDKQAVAFGIEIDVLAYRVSEFYAGSDDVGEEDARGCLNRLLVVGEDLRKTCENVGRTHIASLAAMEIALVKRLLNGSRHLADREVQLLVKLAKAIRRALSVERDSVVAMKEIADTIGAYTLKH